MRTFEKLLGLTVIKAILGKAIKNIGAVITVLIEKDERTVVQLFNAGIKGKGGLKIAWLYRDIFAKIAFKP